MIHAAEIIRSVARYLTDYDSTDPAYQHVEWSKRDLLDYFRTAVQMVVAADDSASTCRKELPLTGEPILDLPDGCDTLLKVIGYVDPTGQLHMNVKLQKNDEDVYTSPRPVCQPGRNTSAPAITLRVDEHAGDVVTIEPADLRGHLVLTCSCFPDVEDENGSVKLSTKYEPVVFWWMVSMAFGTDIEAVPMRERSDKYWTRGADIMLLINPKSRVRKRSAPE